MPNPVSIIGQSSVFGDSYSAMWGDVGNRWSWQAAPRYWNPGKGGAQNDPIKQPLVRGASAGLRSAINKARSVELQTRRQINWNAHSNSGGPVPIEPIQAQLTSYHDYMNNFVRQAGARDVILYGAGGLLVYYMFFK
jgi:hypothetical protein